MGWNVFQDIWRQTQGLQEFQPVQQPGCACRVAAHLELAQPDEPTDLAINHLGQQSVQFLSCQFIKPASDPAVYPTLGGNQSVSAKPLDNRDTGQDGLRPTTFFDKRTRQLEIGGCGFSFLFKPSLETTRTLAREHLEAVEPAKIDQVPATRHIGLGIAGEVFGALAKLCSNKSAHLQRYDLPRCQKPAGISEST